MGGVATKQITRLGCEKYFFEGDIVSITGNALWSANFKKPSQYTCTHQGLLNCTLSMPPISL
jgi:hypothetical protein